jgi:lysophospholipase L1-like esterase
MAEDLKNLVMKWKSNPANGIRIIAYGSSNTEMHWHSEGKFNWVAWLNAVFREYIGKHVVIINQGIGGDTVNGLLQRFNRDIVPFSPHAVIITIGGNDANRGVPLQSYIEDLQKLIHKIQDLNAIPILQTYYCPLFEKMGKDFQHFPDFMEANRTLARDLKIPIIDQYSYFEQFYRQNPKQYRKIMRDGLHVNPIGNYLMGKIACRLFGLPDPKISNDIIKINFIWGLMTKYFPHALSSH